MTSTCIHEIFLNLDSNLFCSINLSLFFIMNSENFLHAIENANEVLSIYIHIDALYFKKVTT